MCYAERKDVFYIPDGWDGYSDISSSEDEVDPDNVPPVPGSQGFIAFAREITSQPVTQRMI